MVRKIFIVIAGLFFSVLTFPSFAQLSPDKIDSLMEEALTKLKVAGASIAVVKDGRTILQRGYGLASIAARSAVTEFTNFQIASNSKAFTSAALSILVDEGKIKWDDRVKDYIPEFKMYNEYVTDNFTMVWEDGSLH